MTDATPLDDEDWVDAAVTFAEPPPPTRLERVAVRLARRSHRAAMLILATPILGPALRRYAELEYRRAVRTHLEDDA